MGELILWTGKGMVLEVIDGHWSMVGEGEFDAKVVYLKDEEKYQILCNAVDGGILLDRISPELKHEKARKGFVQWIDGKKAYGLKIRDDGKADALVKVIESAKKREHVMKKGANNSFFGSLSRKNSRGSTSPGTPGSSKGVSGDVFALVEEVRREGLEQREVLRNELAEVRAALARMEGRPSPAPTSSFYRPQEASPPPTILSAPVKTAPAGPPPAGPPAPPASRGPPPPPAPAMGGPPPPPPPASGGGPPPPPAPASGGGPPPPPPPPSGQAAPSSGGGMSLAEQLAAKKAGGLKSSGSPAPKASAPPKMDMMEQIRNRPKKQNTTTQAKMAPPPVSAPPTRPPAGGPPPPPPSGSGPPPPPPGGPGGNQIKSTSADLPDHHAHDDSVAEVLMIITKIDGESSKLIEWAKKHLSPVVDVNVASVKGPSMDLLLFGNTFTFTLYLLQKSIHQLGNGLRSGSRLRVVTIDRIRKTYNEMLEQETSLGHYMNLMATGQLNDKNGAR